jgi:hypothetical protein
VIKSRTHHAASAAITSFVISHLASMVTFAALWAWQAFCYTAGDLGATIGPLGGGWLYQHRGVQCPFYANGIVLCLWLQVPGHSAE